MHKDHTSAAAVAAVYTSQNYGGVQTGLKPQKQTGLLLVIEYTVLQTTTCTYKELSVVLFACLQADRGAPVHAHACRHEDICTYKSTACVHFQSCITCIFHFNHFYRKTNLIRFGSNNIQGNLPDLSRGPWRRPVCHCAVN